MDKAQVWIVPDLEAGWWRAKVVRFPMEVGNNRRKMIEIHPSPEVALFAVMEAVREFWGEMPVTVVLDGEVLDPVSMEMALRQAHGTEWANRICWNVDAVIEMISLEGWDIEELKGEK